jgi:putative colanic acid biosynthesis acetyltransferase WcaF
MTNVDLSNYDNSWYTPGRSSLVRAAWFLVGSPIVTCSINPSSSLRRLVLRLFGSKIGAGVVLKPGLRIKYPWKLEVGDNTWIGEDCWIDCLELVTIGSNVCLSQGCYLCTGNHDWSDPLFGLIVKKIQIRDCAWVGAKSIVCPGVQLGEGSVLGAGGVAKGDIPSMEIWAGNPAKFVRRRDIRQSSMLAQVAST